MKKKHNLFILLFVFGIQCGMGQTIFGKWKTIDDQTGKTKSIVEIYEKQGKIYGTIRQVLEKGKENAVCINCKGSLKNTPIVGIDVVRGLIKKGDKCEGGTLFDPEHGKEYRGKIWLNPKNSNELMVRGYVAFFFRTQTWLRVSDQ